MTFPRLATALSLLAFATLPLNAAHAAEPAIQASTSLSGLSYRLIDLAPSDGITSQVIFTSGLPLMGLLDYSPAPRATQTSVGGAPFNVAPGGFDGGPGQVSGRIGGTAQSLSLSVQADQIVNPVVMAQVDQHDKTNPYLSASLHGAGGQIYTLSPDIRWEITPHTALVIEGQISAELSLQLAGIDRSQLSPYIDGQGRTLNLNVSGSSSISLISDLWRNNPFAANPGPISSATVSFDRKISWTRQGDQDQSGVDSHPGSHAFTLTIDNTGTKRMGGTLDLSSSLYASTQLSPTPFDPTTSVPEPATWLMLVTGLAALPFARRKKQAKA